MGKKIIYIFILLLSLFCLLFFLFCNNKNKSAIIKEQTELLLKPTWIEAPGNRIISILQNKTKVVILSSTYSKDCLYYKIRTKNGLTGYVVWYSIKDLTE